MSSTACAKDVSPSCRRANLLARRAGAARWLLTAFVLHSICAGIARAQPPVEGIPPRLTELSDLKKVMDPKSPLTPGQKTSLLLSWLAQERRRPSPTSVGKGGFDIDSGYLQAQILQVLTISANPALLDQLGSRLRDPGLRDSMHLALAMMRDRRQVQPLVGILQRSREPYLRWRAAQSLGGLGSQAAVPALKRALEDPFRLTSHGGGSKAGTVIYPVRQMAKLSLGVLKDAKVQKELAKGGAEFDRRLAAARKAPLTADGGPTVDQAAAILNGR